MLVSSGFCVCGCDMHVLLADCHVSRRKHRELRAKSQVSLCWLRLSVFSCSFPVCSASYKLRLAWWCHKAKDESTTLSRMQTYALLCPAHTRTHTRQARASRVTSNAVSLGAANLRRQESISYGLLQQKLGSASCVCVLCVILCLRVLDTMLCSCFNTDTHSSSNTYLVALLFVLK